MVKRPAEGKGKGREREGREVDRAICPTAAEGRTRDPLLLRVLGMCLVFLYVPFRPCHCLSSCEVLQCQGLADVFPGLRSSQAQSQAGLGTGAISSCRLGSCPDHALKKMQSL